MFLNSLSLARNGFKGVTETYKSKVLDLRASTWIWPQGSHSSLTLLLPGTWNSELVGKFPFQQARKEFSLTHSQKEQQSQQEPEDYTDMRDADEENLLKIRKPPTGSEAWLSNLHSSLNLTPSGCLAQQGWIQDSFLDEGLYLQFHQHGSLGNCPNSCHHTDSIYQHKHIWNRSWLNSLISSWAGSTHWSWSMTLWHHWSLGIPGNWYPVALHNSLDLIVGTKQECVAVWHLPSVGAWQRTGVFFGDMRYTEGVMFKQSNMGC